MINVLHVMTRMASGGTENQMVGMLKAAHQKYWNATLCTLSGDWPLADDVKEAGIPVVTIPGRTRLDPRRAVRFRQLATSTDVVHSSLSGANAFSRLSTFGSDHPVIVISERGVDPDRGRSRRLADRLLRTHTDAYIGNSPDVTEFIRSSHHIGAADPRVFEVGNGLDTEIFYPAPAEPRIGPTRIITASRLVASKRLDIAIGILRRLARSIEVELMVVGDGPERPYLENLARGLPVTFVGHVSERSKLAELLRSSDVFLFTSETEGLPNAILEALSCGIPVVASDAPGVRSAAGPGVTLVNGEEDLWCRSILDAIRRGRTSEGFGGERFGSFDDVAKRHLDVFQWAMQRSQGSRQGRRQLGNSTFSEVL